ncbi:MAG: NAD-dependent epimerase/dehydratase family protein [Desulfosudaceae bacterium]
MSSEKLAEPVLVTGATGFIGSRVVHHLRRAGRSVKALVLPGETVPHTWGEAVEIIRGSIDDPAAVAAAAAGSGTIIHLAAIVSDWGDESLYWRLTVEGSRLLFEQAVQNDSRLVLASSIVVYGDNIRKGACAEKTPYGKTFGPYSRTKQAQEKLAWEFYRERGLRLTVVRPANVYGPGSGPWLHDIVDVLSTGAPGLISGGTGNAGLVYVDNVAEILIRAGAASKAVGRVYNACDGLEVTWHRYFSDLAEMIGAGPPGSVPRFAAVVGAVAMELLWKTFGVKKRPPLTREALNLIGSDNRVPVDRLRAELGYEPRVDYAGGMAATKTYLDQWMEAS